jgi:hypothetical protein
MVEIDNFTSENILLYSPQRDGVLSTSKKESKRQWNMQLALSQKNMS